MREDRTDHLEGERDVNTAHQTLPHFPPIPAAPTERIAPITLPSLAQFNNPIRLPSICSLSQIATEPFTHKFRQQEPEREEEVKRPHEEPEVGREKIVWSEDTPPCVLVPSVLYHNTPFPIEIVMGKRWRGTREITVDDVRQSGNNMRLVLEGAPDLYVRTCKKCHKSTKPIIEIGSSAEPDFGPLSVADSIILNDHSAPPDETDPQVPCVPESPDNLVPVSPTAQESLQLEMFRFSNCKTHCTSSRLHLGSRLILIFHFDDKGATLSKPIELLSKKPRTGTTKMSLSDICDDVDEPSDDSAASSPSSPDESAPSLPSTPTTPVEDDSTIEATTTATTTATTEACLLPQNCLAQGDVQSPSTTNPSKKARLSDVLT